MFTLHRWLQRTFGRSRTREQTPKGYPVELEANRAPWVLVGSFEDDAGGVHQSILVHQGKVVVFASPERMWRLAWDVMECPAKVTVYGCTKNVWPRTAPTQPVHAFWLFVESGYVFRHLTRQDRLLAAPGLRCVGVFPRPLSEAGPMVGDAELMGGSDIRAP